MIMALDHLIFGNGWGLGSPYHDKRYYWLVNTANGDRHGRNGELYSYSAGLGAQLSSIQWTHPNAGEERKLANRRFRPLHSNRTWGRVQIAWSWVDLPRDINEANAALRELERELAQ